MNPIRVVGAGALGSHVVQFLRNEECPLDVIDFDKVEQKNVMSQFHSKMGVRKNKANSLMQSMAGLFGVGVQAFPHKLTKDNVMELLVDAELVIDCTDNIEARRIIGDFCSDNDYACLHGGLAAGGTFARVMWNEIFVPDAADEGEATCEDGEFLPFIALTASWMAVVAQKFIRTNKKESYQITPSGVLKL